MNLFFLQVQPCSFCLSIALKCARFLGLRRRGRGCGVDLSFLVAVQGVHDVVAGNYPTSETDALFLAALQVLPS